MERKRDVFKVRVSDRRLPTWIAEAASRFLGRLLGFQEFNALYRSLPACDPVDFSRTLAEAMGVRLLLDGEGLEGVPSTGPLVVVSNHPFGLMEGVVLDAALLSRRPNGVAAILTHYLAAIPEFTPRGIFVDPQRNRRRRVLSLDGLWKAFGWLEQGNILLVFPAGRVARFQWRNLSVVEQPWSPHVAGIARRLKVPVLPIHVHGQSRLFYRAIGAIYPPIQDHLNLRQTNAMRGVCIRATVGRIVGPDELARFSSDEEASDFLRAEVDALDAGRD